MNFCKPIRSHVGDSVATSFYRLATSALIVGMAVASLSVAVTPAEALETISRPASGSIARPSTGPVTEPFVGTAEGENDY